MYGGSSDLTGALGWEEDGKTFVMFRRKMVTSGKADHPFKDKLHFVWAHGQTGDDFYAADELKYHSGNRGSSIIREFIFICFVFIGLIKYILLPTFAVVPKQILGRHFQGKAFCFLMLRLQLIGIVKAIKSQYMDE